MAKSCVYVPSRGVNFYNQLRKEFGYNKAWDLFYMATSKTFQKTFKDSLNIDSEGVPDYQSFMSIPYVRSFIGNGDMTTMLSSKFTVRPDLADNFATAVGDADTFNQSSPFKDSYVAIVTTENKDIKVKVVARTEDTARKAREQKAAIRLHQKLASMFSDLGVTLDFLSEEDVQAGRVGLVDFSKARDRASGFASLISIADNSEGAMSISHEFAHLIIGLLKGRNRSVQRALNVLKEKPEILRAILGSEYEETVELQDGNMELVAEEALGQLLNDRMISRELDEYSSRVVDRSVEYIKEQFEGRDRDSLLEAIAEADDIVNTIAGAVATNQLNRKDLDLDNVMSDAKFNALSETVKHDIQTLYDTIHTIETKSYTIRQNENKRETIKKNITSYQSARRGSPEETAQGILNYAKAALEELVSCRMQMNLIDSLDEPKKYSFLRTVRRNLQAYAPFIKQLNDLNRNSDEYRELFDTAWMRDLAEDESFEGTLQKVLQDLNHMTQDLDAQFKNAVKPLFVNFIGKYIDAESLVIQKGKNKGKKITVEQLLDEADFDISFMDYWLDSMGTSSNVLLQAFDTVVKKAKAKTREQTQQHIRRIQNLMQRFEKLGITDMSKYFDVDSEGNKTGKYIQKYDYTALNEARAKMNKQLDDKYGKKPKGIDLVHKNAAKKAWEDAQYTFEGGRLRPADKWKHKVYEAMSEEERKLYEEFLDLKDSFNKMSGEKLGRYEAIQVRKNGTQRILDMASHPDKIFESVKESMKDAIFENASDESEFGVRTSLTDFTGAEFMTLPILYVNKLKNPNELSTDMFGTLIMYAHMAQNYENMQEILDPLELGRDYVTNYQTVYASRGSMPVVEKIIGLGQNSENRVKKTGTSYIVQKLNSFFASQVYGRYLEDQGAVQVGEERLNANKIASLLLRGSSLAQLGFNYLANLANVLTGASMQNIEAVAGEYFSAGELLHADKTYASLMGEFMQELGSRTKQSKLALFDELFEVRQDFNEHVRHSQMHGLLKRIFGSGVAFMGQSAGDHWMYNRTALAITSRMKVNVPGKGTMSLYDALQVVEDEATGFKKMILPKGTTWAKGKLKNFQEGTKVDAHEVSEFIAHINHTLFGVYNDADSNAANRVILGRLLQQYKKWMKPQFNKRFMAGQYVQATHQFEEGYYRTVARLSYELMHGSRAIVGLWSSLSDSERSNVLRAVTEMGQCFIVFMLANGIKWSDDKKRPWALKLAEYSSQRLVHELGALTPSHLMILENMKTFKSPMAAASYLEDWAKLFASAMNPMQDWDNEIASGPYKGHSTLYKNFMSAPIPGIAQTKQIDKFLNKVDNSILFYTRGW